MRRLGTALALLLALGATAACFGLFPNGSLGIRRNGPPSVNALQTAHIRQVSFLETEANVQPFYDLHTDHPAITQHLIQGIREQREEIVIPMVLPLAEDEEITRMLLHQVDLAIDSVRRDAPEVFWISLGSYTIGWNGERRSGYGALTIRIGYCLSPHEVAAMEEEMETIIESILFQAPSNPAEATVYFHDWIVENTVYASALMAEQGDMQGYEYGFNINGVFLQGSAVCEGYSKAFKLLCDRAGIPCRTVYGVANGENHSWNYVELDGQWYLVDCTWDDPVGEENLLLHNHLLKGSQSYVDDRTIEEIYHNDYAQYPALSALAYQDKTS
jgi:hypothetical protein